MIKTIKTMYPLEELLTISGVEILTGYEGGYVCFISDMDVCTDGSGPSHGDHYHLDDTAYQPVLNADEDRYIVIPPQIRMNVDPVVMGCHARLTNLITGKWWSAVVGDIGPDEKTGEVAYCLAKLANRKVTANSGDDREIYLYELWPGKAATVNGKKYKLQPAG